MALKKELTPQEQDDIAKERIQKFANQAWKAFDQVQNRANTIKAGGKPVYTQKGEETIIDAFREISIILARAELEGRKISGLEDEPFSKIKDGQNRTLEEMVPQLKGVLKSAYIAEAEERYSEFKKVLSEKQSAGKSDSRNYTEGEVSLLIKKHSELSLKEIFRGNGNGDFNELSAAIAKFGTLYQLRPDGTQATATEKQKVYNEIGRLITEKFEPKSELKKLANAVQESLQHVNRVDRAIVNGAESLGIKSDNIYALGKFHGKAVAYNIDYGLLGGGTDPAKIKGEIETYADIRTNQDGSLKVPKMTNQTKAPMSENYELYKELLTPRKEKIYTEYDDEQKRGLKEAIISFQNFKDLLAGRKQIKMGDNINASSLTAITSGNREIVTGRLSIETVGQLDEIMRGEGGSAVKEIQNLSFVRLNLVKFASEVAEKLEPLRDRSGTGAEKANYAALLGYAPNSIDYDSPPPLLADITKMMDVFNGGNEAEMNRYIAMGKALGTEQTVERGTTLPSPSTPAKTQAPKLNGKGH